ncbi:hypothetical protein Glove_33g198 [Diversispora epigaea]|uniref:Uncharacterized protein n=1 Tax=Diversispora epigaea TaxID=1348612 RepID=A0A397JR66_9GLOM|nr:hypothetical protein Glove_33g198 [Diversispora epigaea]
MINFIILQEEATMTQNNVKHLSVFVNELNREKLNLEFERLREIMRAIIQKAIEEYNRLIFGGLNVNVMNSSRAYKKYIELISQEVSRLLELYACLN